MLVYWLNWPITVDVHCILIQDHLILMMDLNVQSLKMIIDVSGPGEEPFPFPQQFQWMKDGLNVTNSSRISYGYPPQCSSTFYVKTLATILSQPQTFVWIMKAYKWGMTLEVSSWVSSVSAWPSITVVSCVYILYDCHYWDARKAMLLSWWSWNALVWFHYLNSQVKHAMGS